MHFLKKYKKMLKKILDLEKYFQNPIDKHVQWVYNDTVGSSQRMFDDKNDDREVMKHGICTEEKTRFDGFSR